MPEWLAERGVGELRLALVDAGRIIEARIAPDGLPMAGTVLAARLISTGRHALARANGQDYLLPAGALGRTEGSTITIEIVREALTVGETWKRPLARLTNEAPRPAPLFEGRMLSFPIERTLDDAGWPGLIEEARSGIIDFPGGSLRVAVTPAMTLIDVDGTLDPVRLAVAAAKAAAAAIRRHGIGGSIGIDFPTIAGKVARQEVAAAIDVLLPQPFERTAVNGFGFLQIVRPRRHASLFELAADRPSFEARDLLRRAGRQVGATRIVAHPAVATAIERGDGWVDQLAQHVGGAVSLRADATLAMAGGYAERA